MKPSNYAHRYWQGWLPCCCCGTLTSPDKQHEVSLSLSCCEKCFIKSAGA